jgi:hypothetical protein
LESGGNAILGSAVRGDAYLPDILIAARQALVVFNRLARIAAFVQGACERV